MMSNNDRKNAGLKVVFKQDMNAIVPQVEATQDRNSEESFAEAINRLREGYNRLMTALHHKLEHHTFGFFSKVGGMTFVKVCILLIIMFFILKPDIAPSSKKTNFAPETALAEKTNANKRQKELATPASMGSAVNDLAPAAPEDLRETQVRAYIDRYTKTAVGEMDKFGIPASISMAQAIVESRSGTSTLAVRNNNHFGVKCFSKSCPDGHCSNFTDDHHKDFFRKYAGTWESWREHSQFLMKNSYRKLLKYNKDYRAWARGLKEIGYATDPTYDKKLITIIERYELHKLDDL